MTMRSQKEITLKDDLGAKDRLDIYRNFLLYCMSGDVVALPMGSTGEICHPQHCAYWQFCQNQRDRTLITAGTGRMAWLPASFPATASPQTRLAEGMRTMKEYRHVTMLSWR